MAVYWREIYDRDVSLSGLHKNNSLLYINNRYEKNITCIYISPTLPFANLI